MKPGFADARTRRRRRHPARHWLALYRLCRSVAVGLPVVSPALVAKDRLGCHGAAGFSAANVLEASRKIPDRGCAQGQIGKGKALFDERCKTAGAKVYKTVEDVEGVLLQEVWPRASDSDWHNPH